MGSGAPKELLVGDTALYLPTGHLIYAVDSSLFAVPFDPAKLEIKGGAVPVVEGVFGVPHRNMPYPIRER
jgi:hypothetical protein